MKRLLAFIGCIAALVVGALFVRNSNAAVTPTTSTTAATVVVSNPYCNKTAADLDGIPQIDCPSPSCTVDIECVYSYYNAWVNTVLNRYEGACDIYNQIDANTQAALSAARDRRTECLANATTPAEVDACYETFLAEADSILIADENAKQTLDDIIEGLNTQDYEIMEFNCENSCCICE